MPSLKAEIEARLQGGRGAALADRGGARTLEGFLAGVGRVAPYLARLLRAEHVPALLNADPERSWQGVMAAAACPKPDTAAGLRAAKADAALLLALLDLAGVWSMTRITAALSDFADACAEAALRLAWVEATGGSYPSPRGIGVLALGKLGARTLNYSSDIDLVVAYDPARLPEGGRSGPRGLAVRIAQRMVALLSEQTAAGYVFRTDLRLRPDPSSSALAVSLAQAERYYETYGQNWERAAYIKARHCAGDPDVTGAYLEIITPFVWRRTLDFAALADIKAVKAQIHAKVGSPEIQAAGGNVKLGPGGIREVEFFAETQQLILGGREPKLRTPATLDTLAVLQALGRLGANDAEALQNAYAFLRDTEHRLQMREDEPTQTVPTEDAARADVACMMGFGGLSSFDEALVTALRAVHDRYADLFEVDGTNTAARGSLVFTGVDDDPRTMATLKTMGFAHPEAAAAMIRRWHQGGLPATKSLRARELLTNLVPRILGACAETENADAALAAVGGFFSQLPQALGLFALFTAHGEVLDDVVALCAAAPDLAQRLARRPSLVDGLLTDDHSTADVQRAQLGFEETMDDVRWQVGGEQVRLGARIALGREDPYAVGRSFSDLADDAIGTLFEAAGREAERRGEAATPPLALLGFGRLGTRSLTMLSDLDLVFVYDGDPSEGPHVLKRVRRLVAALSAPTAAGILYEVDMRLRPSGGAGPAAVTLAAFERYYAENAQGWEAMALTKARVVWSEGGAGIVVDEAIAERLACGWMADRIATDAKRMRARLLQEHPPAGPLDVKRLAGGMTDLDFIAQVLSLSAPRDRRPPRTSPEAIRSYAEEAHLDEATRDRLLRAHRLFETVTQYARATTGGGPMPVPEGIQARRLKKMVGDDRDVVAQIEDESAFVQRVFAEVCGI